ncbi:hypothetical protein ACFFGV_20475 [Pontibacillus salicampi]|uniref:Uncharacterized protein n=1 Tax=Pontibacillus salicampi TaxID=1449801 RepID=A0ABV6LU57_9BACI
MSLVSSVGKERRLAGFQLIRISTGVIVIPAQSTLNEIVYLYIVIHPICLKEDPTLNKRKVMENQTLSVI